MLTKQQVESIELIFEGELTLTEIAEKVGVGRKTLYNWRTKDEEFRNTYQKLLDERLGLAKGKFVMEVEGVTDELLELIYSEDLPARDKINAIKYWLDHALGKPVANMEVTQDITHQEKEVKEEDILAAFDEK